MGNFGRDNRGGGRSFGGDRGGFGGGRGRGFGGGFGRGDDRHEMFNAVCSECGKDCKVPFRPTNGKPVYCSDCFEKINGGRESRRPERSDFRAPQAPSFDQNKAQFDAINAKLDRILGILAPAPVTKVEEVSAPEIAETVVKEAKPEKAKKVVKKTTSKKE